MSLNAPAPKVDLHCHAEWSITQVAEALYTLNNNLRCPQHKVSGCRAPLVMGAARVPRALRTEHLSAGDPYYMLQRTTRGARHAASISLPNVACAEKRGAGIDMGT